MSAGRCSYVTQISSWSKFVDSLTFIYDIFFLITKEPDTVVYASTKRWEWTEFRHQFHFWFRPCSSNLNTGAIVWAGTRLKGWMCRTVTAGYCVKGSQVMVVVTFPIEMVITSQVSSVKTTWPLSPICCIEESCTRQDRLSRGAEFVSEN
jgi:hypothetical protein